MSTPRLCGCGCGEPVARRYKPGHDARHKAALIQAAIDATKPHQTEAAIEQVFEHGWEAFLPLDLLRNHPIRNHRRQPRIHIEKVERFLIDPDGTHHARHNCTQLTKTARKHGLINPTTRLAREAAIHRVDPTPSLIHHLKHSFDACPECTIDWTWDEIIEANQTRKATTLDAIDHTTPGWKPKPNPPRKSTPFQVDPDPIPVLWFPLPLLSGGFVPFLLVPPTTRVDLVLERC
jgi:hypothetical protein